MGFFTTYDINGNAREDSDFDNMTQEVYVLDTETTGLFGAPKDLVVDIGIARVDLEAGTVHRAYSSVLGYEVDEWDDYYNNAWIFENTDMTVDMVREAPPAKRVMEVVREILDGKVVTSYNIAYDMDKFLYQEPWNLKDTFLQANDIMLAASKVCKLPGLYGDYKYPKLDYAYEKIVDGDPAGINGVQDHRAYSDAVMASYLMITMYRNGQYRLFGN